MAASLVHHGGVQTCIHAQPSASPDLQPAAEKDISYNRANTPEHYFYNRRLSLMRYVLRSAGHYKKQAYSASSTHR